MTNNVHAIPVNMSGDEEGVDQFLHKFDMLSNDRAMILLESFRCIEEDDIDEMETEEPLFPPGMSSESEQDEETGELVIEAAEVAKEAEEQPEPEEPAPCTQAQVRQALEVLTDYAFQSAFQARCVEQITLMPNDSSNSASGSGGTADELFGLSELGVRVMDQSTLERTVHAKANREIAEKEMEAEQKRLVRVEAALLRKREQIEKSNETAAKVSSKTVRYQNALDRIER
ncbi:hypothetical protein H4217_004878, partial [Coemansia sp. RSA 1939]